MRVTRRDSGTLARAEKTPEGFLRVEGVIARACLLEYMNADGTVRHELVTPEALFEPASLRSFAVLALTDTHPSELLTPATVQQHQIGSVGEPRRDGDSLVSMLGILSAGAVKAVESGTAELSCGYSCEVEEQSGDHPSLRCPNCNTGHYDGVQKERRGNHVAIVPAGRAGPAARIHLDSAGNVCAPVVQVQEPVIASPSPLPTNPETAPMKIKIGAHHFDANDASATVIQEAIDRLETDLKSRVDTLSHDKAEREKQLAAAVKRGDAFKGKVISFRSKLRASLDAMMKREVTCDECGGAKTLADGSKCPSCDGAGTHSARDAIKAMPAPEGAPHPDEDVAGMEEMSESEEDGLDADPVPPAPSPEVAAKADAARKVASAKRADARKALRQRRSDSLCRIADRRAAVRASLIVAAQGHLGTEEKLDGKSDVEVKRAVVAKLAPHLDAAKLDAGSIEVLYASEIKRTASEHVDGGELPAPTPSDLARAGMLPTGAPARRADAVPTVDAAEAKANAWQRPMVQPGTK